MTTTHAVTIHPRAAGRGNAAHPNFNDWDLLYQTEIPGHLMFRGLKQRKSQAFADDMATRFGGTWRKLPGRGCPGEWVVDGLTPAQMLDLAKRCDATIVVYVYGGQGDHGIPAELAGFPAYRNSGGYHTPRPCDNRY